MTMSALSVVISFSASRMLKGGAVYLEERRAIEFADEPARGGRQILVDHNHVNLFHFECGGIHQDDQLHNRHDKNNRKHRPVAEDLDEFFLYDEEDAAHGVWST